MATFTHIPNEFRGSHISIFPLKEFPGENNSNQRNGDSIRLANELKNFILPSNFWYYLKAEKPEEITKFAPDANSPKYRWYPDEELLDILRGKCPVLLSGDIKTLPEEKYIGWIDYADNNGYYYSATKTGFSVTTITKDSKFRNCLIETYGKETRKARSCENLNNKELQEMDLLYKRAMFLSKVMGIIAGIEHKRHTLKQANEFLSKNELRLEEIHGKGNYLTSLDGKTFQFEKIQ